MAQTFETLMGRSALTQDRPPPFRLADRVIDGDGFQGTIVKVTEWEGSRWYDVRFERGAAVRYDSDLRLA